MDWQNIFDSIIFSLRIIYDWALGGIVFFSVERLLEKLFRVDIKLIWIRHKRKSKQKPQETETLKLEEPISSNTGSK